MVIPRSRIAPARAAAQPVSFGFEEQDMGIRDLLERNPAGSKAIAVAIIVICGVAIFLQNNRSRPAAANVAVGKAFFSDDDGKTWFLDDASKFPPFDHEGATAYRAIVFRCKSGVPFVGFLAKYSAGQIAQLHDDARRNPGMPPRMQVTAPHDLRKPGQSHWITNSKSSMTGYPDVPCPDGSGNAVLLMPTDPDSGAKNL